MESSFQSNLYKYLFSESLSKIRFTVLVCSVNGVLFAE